MEPSPVDLQAMPHEGDALIVSQWPKPGKPKDLEALQHFEQLQSLVSGVSTCAVDGSRLFKPFSISLPRKWSCSSRFVQFEMRGLNMRWNRQGESQPLS